MNLSYESIMLITGKNIKHIRKTNKLTQKGFAHQLNVSRPSLGSYEECRAFPSIMFLIKLSEICGHGIKTLVTTDISKIVKGVDDEQ